MFKCIIIVTHSLLEQNFNLSLMDLTMVLWCAGMVMVLFTVRALQKRLIGEKSVTEVNGQVIISREFPKLTDHKKITFLTVGFVPKNYFAAGAGMSRLKLSQTAGPISKTFVKFESFTHQIYCRFQVVK